LQVEMEDFIAKFAVEYVVRFREHTIIREAAMASTRQAIAIAKLVFARYMKNGELTDNDFMEAAVVTSHPSVQKIAEEVAKETLTKLFGGRAI
jgi:hypothetical protein